VPPEPVGREHAELTTRHEVERVAGLAFADHHRSGREAAQHQGAEHTAKRGLRQRREQRDRMERLRELIGALIEARRRLLGAGQRATEHVVAGRQRLAHVRDLDLQRLGRQRDPRRALAEQLGLAAVADDERGGQIAGFGAVRLEDARTDQRAQRMPSLQAVPTRRAVHPRRARIAEGERGVGDPDAGVEVARRTGHDGVVQAQRSEGLALREQCGRAALDVPERDHACTVHEWGLQRGPVDRWVGVPMPSADCPADPGR